MLRSNTIRTRGSRPFRAEAFRDGQWPRWLPQGVLVSRYFPGRQTVAGIGLKLASRDLPAARRGPRMRQDRRRLCGSPLRHKRANGPARAAAHALGRQNRASGLREPDTGPSILRRRDTHARQPTAQRRTRLRFAPVTVTGDRFSAPNNNWLGSRPICGPSFGRADPQFSGSLAMLAAMRRASSRVSCWTAARAFCRPCSNVRIR
jgi:hypothetical protein